MAEWMSPQEVYDDPKRWLSVPHLHHSVILQLMQRMFPDFREKLEDIHCLECEGEEPFEVWNIEDRQMQMVTGYIKHGDEPVSLLRTINVKEYEEARKG